MVATGYYQLYFLLVIMQFYLVFPLVLLLLRRTGNHHGLVVAVAALAQVALTIAMHWNLLPAVISSPGRRTRSATCSTWSAAASSPSTWTRCTRGCAGTHG